jgi:hypothetical protein
MRPARTRFPRDDRSPLADSGESARGDHNEEECIVREVTAKTVVEYLEQVRTKVLTELVSMRVLIRQTEREILPLTVQLERLDNMIAQAKAMWLSELIDPAVIERSMTGAEFQWDCAGGANERP